MADTPLSALTATTTMADAYEMYVNASGASRKITFANFVDELLLEPYTPRLESASFTLDLGDAIVSLNSASATVLTIPPESTTAFPDGWMTQVWRRGTGTVTIQAGTGVTLQGNGGSASAGSCSIQTQYNGAAITKIFTNTWVVAGDINAVS